MTYALAAAGAAWPVLLTWGLYWLSQRPFPGEFMYRGIMAPRIVEGPVTLSTDTRGLV